MNYISEIVEYMDKITVQGQPIVTEPKSRKYQDESERRLAEFVDAADRKRTAANGAKAQEIRNARIASLVKESDKVGILTL
jgi:hypothetical protein